MAVVTASTVRQQVAMTKLRTIHDWIVKPQLRSVRGVAEVNSWGGYEKQYQVRLDTDRLFKYGLTFEQVSEALRANNENVGGGTIPDVPNRHHGTRRLDGSVADSQARPSESLPASTFRRCHR